MNALEPGGEESLVLREARRRVLAEDIIAGQDVPMFDNSSMDGYALRVADLGKMVGGNALAIQGEAAAGTAVTEDLRKNHVYRILTGAPLPPGADAVVEQEMTVRSNGTVTVQGPILKGRNVRRRGEDIKAGVVVVQKGSRLLPAHLGVLASLGLKEVRVYKQPSVAILTTGDELVDADQALEPGKIRNSNAYALDGLVAECGCIPRSVGIARDNTVDLRKKIEEGLSQDVLLTSGGVSVGDHDLVLEVLKSSGVEIVFWRINIKPGMPMAFGIHTRSTGKRVPVFALPGNPVSSLVTFLQYVRPGLEKLQGIEVPPVPFRVRALLKKGLNKTDGKRYFVRGICWNENGQLVVESTGSQSSGILTSLIKANCLIIIPEDVHDPKAGDSLEVELL